MFFSLSLPPYLFLLLETEFTVSLNRCRSPFMFIEKDFLLRDGRIIECRMICLVSHVKFGFTVLACSSLSKKKSTSNRIQDA